MPADAARRILRDYGPLLAALILEVAVFELIGRSQDNPGFASTGNAIFILNQCAFFGIMAIGMTFVIMTGGIDLSIGSIEAIAGVACALAVRHAGGHVWPGILGGWIAALLIGLAAGGLTGLLVTRLDVPPFIATLALMSSVRGAGNLLTGGEPISPLPEAYTWLGRHRFFDAMPVNVALFLALLVASYLLLHHTPLGRHIRAIGGNEESARLSGIPVRRVKTIVYLFCGAMTALAGLVLSSKLGAGSPKVGLGDELIVIAAVVVGGTSLSGGRGSIPGTFMGLLVVQVLSSGLTWIGVETFGQQVTLGIVILGAVLLDKLKPA